MYNVWLPSNESFFYPEGSSATSTLETKDALGGGTLVCRKFEILDAESGMGVVFDHIMPPFAITKPPKICYASSSDLTFVIKDGDGWLWAAPCPQQDLVAERGWELAQFALHSYQDPSKTGLPLPTAPTGNIQTFQLSGADGVHTPFTVGGPPAPQWASIAYIAGRSPTKTVSGDIRRVALTNTNPAAHTWKVGDVDLINGSRREIKYLGALPFGLQMNGPKNRLSPLPYRGPLVAGYQSGTPWIYLNDNAKLTKLLEFMSDAQVQFNERSPDNIMGPWMHIYLPALWDCEQNGAIDSWVWDGPDGNPAWDGWQYRAIDAMGHTWYLANESTAINSTNKALLTTICTRFLDWLYQWLIDHPTAVGVPNDWKPTGWNQGTPLSPDRCLEPKQTNNPSSHDNCLALKGAVFSTLAGYDQTKGKFIIHKCIQFLKPVQVTDTSDMRGAFTLNPAGWEVYGFEQGEILDALALCKQHPELLQE